jgi:hypothetical protein
MYKPRSAVVIRTWHDMEYTPNDLQHVRAMIMELSLHSGAEYEVFLLVHVRDDSVPIFSDEEAVQKLKDEYLPVEFHDMAVFFNYKLLEGWYPKIDTHV